jgi:hypothetical protein
MVRATGKKASKSGKARSKARQPKYFNLHESNSAGMDNAWRVVKKRQGFYLIGNEVGQVGPPCGTIGAALDWDGNQYSGGSVEIDTNIRLEELFEIMRQHNFEPLLDNTDSLVINGAEIDSEAFRKVVFWYATICKNKDTATATGTPRS